MRFAFASTWIRTNRRRKKKNKSKFIYSCGRRIEERDSLYSRRGARTICTNRKSLCTQKHIIIRNKWERKKKSRGQSQWLWMLACDRKSTLNKINIRATFVLCRWRRHHCRRRRCLITVIAGGQHVHGRNGLQNASIRFKLHINRAAWLSWVSCARRRHQWI